MTEDRQRTKRLLERASQGHVPLEPLLSAVSGMLQEAGRRRRLAATPSARIFDVAASWVPRLAAVTVTLTLAAVLLSRMAPASATTRNGDPATSIERWILKDGGQAPDTLLDSLVLGGSQ